MELPLHTERGAGKYVDRLDANGATIALDLTPASASEIIRAVNNADALADALRRVVEIIKQIGDGGIKSTVWVADFQTSTYPDTKSVFDNARAALAAYRKDVKK